MPPQADPTGAVVHERPPDYETIAQRLKDGTIVPFFGAGASVSCGLPAASDLARRLVQRAGFPDERGRDNLPLVASYLAQTQDLLTLKAELREALAVQAEPGRLHRCLADPRLKNLRLFVTTNYDDLVERALTARRPWVVVDRGDNSGTVWCRRHDGGPAGDWEEAEARTLRELLGSDPQRPIVLKLHGHFDRSDRDHDSFLITEEDYVDFLGRSEGSRIPPMLAATMRERSFLFLGYGLRDWNVRVLLHKLRQSRTRSGSIRSWAIVRRPGQAERQLWRAQDVEMLDVDVEAFAAELEAHLWPP
ncbi:MAG TPA: SIR2 family protein [Rubrivivax sp.]|nr:SIR2 family protein [Burkholderiales bacterium]HNU10674.1 SIR2 family protein [Rubrivivax sp.]